MAGAPAPGWAGRMLAPGTWEEPELLDAPPNPTVKPFLQPARRDPGNPASKPSARKTERGDFKAGIRSSCANLQIRARSRARTCLLARASRAAAAPRAGALTGAVWGAAGTGSALCPCQCQRNSSVGFGEETLLFQRLLWKKGQVWGRRLSDSLRAGRGREVAGRL